MRLEAPQVGFTRLAHFKMLISDKPEISGRLALRDALLRNAPQGEAGKARGAFKSKHFRLGFAGGMILNSGDSD